MFDFSHPAFRPLWLRLAVVAVALGWALFEALTGSPFWGIVFGALGAAAAWGLLIAYDPEARPEEDQSRQEDRK